MEEENKNLVDVFPLAPHSGYGSQVEWTEDAPAVTSKKSRVWIYPLFFIITLFTTLVAGTRMEGLNPFENPAFLRKGIPFSFTLLAILFVHEMGHYITSKYYKVKTTLPLFIPGFWWPYGIGTFGAVIRMRSPILLKRALLEIGAAGPIAGFVVAVGAVIIGLKLSSVVETDSLRQGIILGEPLFFSGLSHLLLHVPDGYDVFLHPVAFAGWVGFFVTSLNLLPIGQLDGGHIAYAILGKRQRQVSMGMVLCLVLLGLYSWPGWFVWAVLPTVVGMRHPPVMDEEVPLTLRQKVIGWVSVLLFIGTFIPVPIGIP